MPQQARPHPEASSWGSDQATSTLVALWEEASEAELKSPEQNFFDDGGDSLGATMLLIGIKEKLGVEVSLGTFLDDPTFSAMLAIIEERRRSSQA